MATPARVKHLRYEVQMLGEMRRKLQAREFNDQWTANALIEAFCVHARNLNEFFLEESSHRDILKASSFADGNYKRPRRTKRRRALFAKINKRIAHLTNKRTSVARHKIGDRQREEMFALLYVDLKKFDLYLRAQLRRKWKIIFGEAKKA
jgi:hypothetical protein